MAIEQSDNTNKDAPSISSNDSDNAALPAPKASSQKTKKTNESKQPKESKKAKDSKAFDSKTFLAQCSKQAGVYQMYDINGKHLYIGKAKNLKNRLSSYFRKQIPGTKTAALVVKIAHIDVTVTASETDALILEQNLIKAERPPYNILLRDDKSYPYIFLSDQHDYPRLSFHRGSKRAKGKYFGPFPSSHSVRESLSLLQKVFKVRQCEDAFFNNRSRPCLQHQIGRCSAPCVNRVSKVEYDDAVRQSTLFLDGRNEDLNKELGKTMETAATELEFEKAADIRDQIAHLRHVQERQFIEGSRGDIDIVAAAMESGHACVQVLYVRRGRMLGSRSFYPNPGIAETNSDLLEAFIAQKYLGSIDPTQKNHTLPGEIIINASFDGELELAAALTEVAGKKVKITAKVNAGRARWQRMASETAQQNLSAKLNSRQQIHQRFEQLQKVLELEESPQRIECFDISHSSGELTVASCVVFTPEGAKKSDYRKFNIEGITGGDDYAAMRQAISRRYTRIKTGEGVLPDILLIDGGKGQLNQALSVLEELQISEILVIGVAKGATRKPGLETLFLGSADQTLNLANDDSALHLIQQIRDEAHRFAITGHRARRAKSRSTSPLEGITGVGPKRRRQLLKHFGGWREVESATLEELNKVEGISHKIAQDIYAALHPS